MTRKTTTSVHPIHKRRVWDLAPGDSIVVDGELEAVAEIHVHPSDKDPRRHAVDLHLANGRTIPTRLWGAAADGRIVDGKLEVLTIGRPNAGVPVHWLMEADRAFSAEHEHWTTGQYRRAVRDYVLAKWPQL